MEYEADDIGKEEVTVIEDYVLSTCICIYKC